MSPIAVFLINCTILCSCMMIAFHATWYGAIVAARAGGRLGVVSHVTERSSHARPTSRLGGAAIAIGYFGPALLLVGALWIMPKAREASWGGNLDLLGLLGLGAFLMFLVGLADDLFDLPPLVKLAGQFAATLPLTASELRFLDLKLAQLPGIAPVAASAALATLWVVFFVNAFNFMDGMDGFATTFAKGIFLWLLAMGAGEIFLSGGFHRARLEFLLLTVAAGACAGFLRVNAPPARVFMGDGGSHLLGYLLAIQVVLADGDYYFLRGMSESEPWIPAGAAWLAMLPFLFDPVATLVRRARLGEPLLRPHRGHLYQRLMIAGASHREVLSIERRRFAICGAAGLVHALADSLADASRRNGWDPPDLVVPAVRLLCWAVGAATMFQFWRLVLAREAEARNRPPTPEAPGPDAGVTRTATMEESNDDESPAPPWGG